MSLGFRENVIFTSKCIPNFRNFRDSLYYRGTHIEMKEFTLVNKPVKFTYDNEDYFIKRRAQKHVLLRIMRMKNYLIGLK